MRGKVFFLILFLVCASNVYALRAKRPLRFTLPWTKEQVNELNNQIDDLYNVQEGRMELDIVTTTKTNANNGEIWILSSSGTFQLQVKAGDAVRSVNLTP